MQENDLLGPLVVAVALEEHVNSEDELLNETYRVVVFGDSNWIRNQHINYYSNKDIFLNSIHWLAGDESSIKISSRSFVTSLEPLSQETLLTMLVSSFLVPELLLLWGTFGMVEEKQKLSI